MNNIKKLLIAASLLAVLILPNLVSAATVEEIKAQLSAMLQQIQQLQQQIVQLQASGIATTTPIIVTPTTPVIPITPVVGWCHTFNIDLKYGDSGDEVKNLHIALEKEGFVITPIEKYEQFKDSTAAAVVGFQNKYKSEILTPLGLTNGTGYVGVSTRAKLNALYGCAGGVPPEVSPPPGPLSFDRKGIALRALKSTLVADSRGCVFGPYPLGFFIEGNYAYIVTQGGALKGMPDYCYNKEGIYATLQIFDISNPANPMRTGWILTKNQDPTGVGSSREVVVSNNYAYIINDNKQEIEIIDVSNKQSLKSAGLISMKTDPHPYIQMWKLGLSADGKYLYVANISQYDGGLSVIDISNPLAAKEIAFLPGVSASQYRDLIVKGNYVYLGGYSGIVVNVSDPKNPVSLARINVPYTDFKKIIETKYSDYNTFIKMWISGEDFKISPEFIALKDNYLFSAYANSYGTFVLAIDISNVSSPKLIDAVLLAKCVTFENNLNNRYCPLVEDLAVEGNRLLVSVNSGRPDSVFYGLKIYDIANPLSLKETMSYPGVCSGGRRTLIARNNYLYSTAHYPNYFEVYEVNTSGAGEACSYPMNFTCQPDKPERFADPFYKLIVPAPGDNDASGCPKLPYCQQIKQAININVSGPTSLRSGQSGSWTLTANNVQDFDVQCGAIWGDLPSGFTCLTNPNAPGCYAQEGYRTYSGPIAFAHTYSKAGTYEANFTCSGGGGAATKLTIIVGN